MDFTSSFTFLALPSSPRTFSKAWSLAGARLGYLLADPDLVRELIKVKLPYNLSHAAIALGEVALEHPRHTARAVGVLRGRRAQWRTALERFGLEVFPSHYEDTAWRITSTTAFR